MQYNYTLKDMNFAILTDISSIPAQEELAESCP